MALMFMCKTDLFCSRVLSDYDELAQKEVNLGLLVSLLFLRLCYLIRLNLYCLTHCILCSAWNRLFPTNILLSGKVYC